MTPPAPARRAKVGRRVAGPSVGGGEFAEQAVRSEEGERLAQLGMGESLRGIRSRMLEIVRRAVVGCQAKRTLGPPDHRTAPILATADIPPASLRRERLPVEREVRRGRG